MARKVKMYPPSALDTKLVQAEVWATKLDKAVAEAFSAFCAVVMLVVVLGLAGLGFWYVMNLKVWELLVGSISIAATLYLLWQYLKICWHIGEAFSFPGLFIFVVWLTPVSLGVLYYGLAMLWLIGLAIVSNISSLI